MSKGQTSWEELVAAGMAKEANFHQDWTRKNQFNKMFEEKVGKMREEIK